MLHHHTGLKQRETRMRETERETERGRKKREVGWPSASCSTITRDWNRETRVRETKKREAEEPGVGVTGDGGHLLHTTPSHVTPQ